MKRDAKTVLSAKGIASVLVACTGLANSTANAATLTGNVIAAEYDQPALGSNKCTVGCFLPTSFTVGLGIESSALVGHADIDFADHSLEITFLQHANFATVTSFNGYVFSVLSGNPFDAVGSVSGIASSLVSEPNGQLAVNLAGLTFETGAQIVVTFAIETPLPGALPLFAAGLGVLGLLGWRRKKKSPAALSQKL